MPCVPMFSESVTTNDTYTFPTRRSSDLSRFDGQGVKTGFSVSRTVTVNVQTFELPFTSVAMFVTVFTLNGNAYLLGGIVTMPGVPQLSEAVTTNVTLLPHCPSELVTSRF